mmetsp:Transcript_30459/g.94548  ORF Transcript_30459/g.94548 Transcript_30459/m.94548 type:complete len:429 (+) Transcript_30459:366-1652(+)
MGRGLRVVHEDGLGRAAEKEARLLRLQPRQRGEVGVDLAAARAVLLHLHDDMGQDGVDEVEVPAVLEGDPVLLGPVVHPAPQGVPRRYPLGVADVHARGHVHLRHGLALPAAVAAQRGVGAEGQLHGPGGALRELEDLGVLRPRHDEARQRSVLGVVDLPDAEVRPGTPVARGAEPGPALQPGQRGDGPHVDPAVPLGPAHKLRAHHDLRVPRLVYARHLRAVVEAAVPRPPRRQAVPPRDDDDLLLAPEEERRVDEHGAVAGALLGPDGQAHVGQAAVQPEDRGEAAAELGVGQEAVQRNERDHDGHGQEEQGLAAGSPPQQLLSGLLHQVDEDDGARGQEAEEEGADAELGPHVPADKLVHVHRVGVALEEVEARRPLGHPRLEARQPREPEQDHGLEGQQHGEAAESLAAGGCAPSQQKTSPRPK